MKKLIVLLAILMCVSLCACSEGNADSGKTQASSSNSSEQNHSTQEQATPTEPEATTAPTTPSIELSNDLADFTVSIEGIVYQLPCGVDQLLQNGWTEGREYTYEVTADDTCMMTLCNDAGKEISVSVWNPGPDTKVYSECMILEISESIWASSSKDATVLIADEFDINANLTTQAVTTAFGGEENAHYHNSSSYGLYYEYDIGHYLFTDLDADSATWAIKIEKSIIRELSQ